MGEGVAVDVELTVGVEVGLTVGIGDEVDVGLAGGACGAGVVTIVGKGAALVAVGVRDGITVGAGPVSSGI